MKITLETTPEIWDAPINGAIIPVRVWRGRTASGTSIEAYVLAIVPSDEADADQLAAEVAPFMRRAQDAFTVNLPKTAEET